MPTSVATAAEATAVINVRVSRRNRKYNRKTAGVSFKNDAILQVPLATGQHSQLNNFSEVQVVPNTIIPPPPDPHAETIDAVVRAANAAAPNRRGPTRKLGTRTAASRPRNVLRANRIARYA